MPPVEAGGDSSADAQLSQVLEETAATWEQVRGTLAGLRAQLATGSTQAAEKEQRPQEAHEKEQRPQEAVPEPEPRGITLAAEKEQRPETLPELGEKRPETLPEPGESARENVRPDSDGGIEPERASVPKAKTTGRRVSAFATGSLADAGEGLGGRLVAIETDSPLLGELECVLIEPMGKRVAPDSFVSAGLLVCLQGMPSSRESIDEWNRAATSAGWSGLGATVAVPNLQMNAALELQDLEAVLDGVLVKAGFERCVLVGKDWGGTVAVELASRSRLAERVDGLILVAPDVPAPPHAHEVAAPVLLLWAHDDDVCSFEDRGTWFEVLDDRITPTTVRECETGAHHLDRILEDQGVSATVKNFTVSAFVLAELEEVEDDDGAEHAPQSDEDADEPARNSRLERLQAELPEFLVAAASQLAEDKSKQALAKRLSLALPHWINAGMAEASE